MFDFVRRHTKIIMGVLFLLVIPSFVLFGIEGYTRFNEGASKVAVVDGKSITQTEWDNAHRQDIDRMRAANPTADLSLLDSPAVKYATLERLVRERVLAAAAAHEHLTVSDQRLAAELAQDPNIAALRRADGSLDMDQYRRLVANQGLTPEGFEARVRADMAANQVLGGVINSELLSPAQADVAMGAFLERREVRVQRFAPAGYTARLNPSDADLEAFYKANLARYQAPESARIEYVVLDLDTVKKGVAVSEQDLRAYYDQNAPALGKPEERRASHILINAPKDAPAAEREKAKATATELLAQLRKAPGTFADVARKSSQDDASAPSGGDLGFFQRDKGIDPTLSKTTYALAKAGDISDVVESDFGYHIVRLTELKPAEVPPFEKLRPQLEDQLRTQQAQKAFGELAEAFTNGVYEQSDSLRPIADKLKLTVHTADGVKHTPAPGATGALANAKFLNALFSTDSLEKKRNTEAVEIGANQLVSGRVVAYTAAHARPLAEVQADVRQAFLNERGAALAREDGQAKLKAWTAQPNTATSLPAAVVVSRDAPQDQPPQLLEAVLRADPAKLPVFVGVDLGAEGYAVARVDKVLPKAEQDAEVAAQTRQRYAQLWASAEARQYYELLKARYKTAILVPAPAGQAAR
ncbi:MAG: SurA N-terminal domain-containing protein [Ottowia sp.]|uniref:SurA N-terminal domain-containing protein n=1 Tax=Ottowia sp. TaxID=1898956 RepID=UPI0039E25A31